MEEHINLLGLDSPQIGFNGGIIFSIKNNGSLHVLKESPMDINVCKNLLYILGVNFPEASLCFFDEYNCFTFKIDEGINMFREVSPQNPIIADINSFFSKNRKILKVTVICPKQNLIDKIISLLNSINLKNISLKKSDNTYLDITNIQADKKNGMLYVLNEVGTNPDDVIAFGDGENDISMLDLVGIPIIMANSLPKLKEMGYYQTSSNDNDGVYAI